MMTDNEILVFERFPAWKELFHIAKDWEYGSIHKHFEIESILHIKNKNVKYYNAVGRANVELADIGKFLLNIKGVGYVTVKPDDYPNAVLNLTNSVYRRMKRVIRVTDGAPIELMTSESLIKMRQMTDRAKDALIMLKTTRKEYKTLLR